MRNPQLNQYGELQHLLTTEGLAPRILNPLLELAQHYLLASETAVQASAPLSGRRVFSLFVEKSVRTCQAFDHAARRLSAEVVHVQVEGSAASSNDGLAETLSRLQAAPGDLLVLAHPQSGAPYLVSQQLAPQMHIINAGDGDHADPTQALANVFAIRHVKKELANLTVALVGDVLHSRIARSCIHALTTLCVAEVRVIGPLTLMPSGLEHLGVRVLSKLSEGLREADVVILLPSQLERVPASLRLSVEDYDAREVVSQETLAFAKPDCLVMHADGHPLSGHSLIDLALNRQALDVAIRMAALSMVAGAQP